MKLGINDARITAIANAIRDKKETQDAYTLAEMPDAIASIETGYPEPTGTISITQNGTQNVKDYASANVNVPNSYGASDEGKVVDNGALVSQTSRTVDTNGTYDTTLNNEVVVDVEGGGATLISKTITQNGTYNAEDDDADGYSEVTVDVSGGGGIAVDYYDYARFANPSVNKGIILLPYLLNNDTEIEVTGLYETGTGYQLMIGFLDMSAGSSNITWERILSSGSNTVYFGNGTSTGQTSVSVTNTTKHKYNINKNGKILIDDVEKLTYVPTTPPNNDVYLTLGGGYYGGSHSPFVGRIYDYKLIKESTQDLICHLKPAVRLSDNVAGMYDEVNDVFYTVTGLTVGNDE